MITKKLITVMKTRNRKKRKKSSLINWSEFDLNERQNSKEIPINRFKIPVEADRENVD
jgi:hypothetical protein